MGRTTPGGAAGRFPGEGDTEAVDYEHLLEELKVATVQFQVDGTEGVARLLEGGGDICEFGHDAEGGGDCIGGRNFSF